MGKIIQLIQKHARASHVQFVKVTLNLPYMHCLSPFILLSQALLQSQYSSFPKRQTVDPSKLKELADNIFKFDKNGENLSKQVENTVG